jgi:ribosomal protein S18 acetylase RimI-like enzyme
MRPWERNAANLEAALKFYGKAEQKGGLTLITSPVAFSVFNIALLDEPVADVDGEIERRIHIAARHFDSQHRPWSFWICEHWLGARTSRRLHRAMKDAGLDLLVESPGMEIEDFSEFPQRPLPLLDCRRVSDDETRAAFRRIVEVCFQIPHDVARIIYDDPTRWEFPLEVWLGYAGGEAIASTAIMQSNVTIGIYSVATLPAYRARGYAEALMRHAVQDARDRGGAGPIVLQSSPMGAELYRKLGFTRTTRFFIYGTR